MPGNPIDLSGPKRPTTVTAATPAQRSSVLPLHSGSTVDNKDGSYTEAYGRSTVIVGKGPTQSDLVALTIRAPERPLPQASPNDDAHCKHFMNTDGITHQGSDFSTAFLDAPRSIQKQDLPKDSNLSHAGFHTPSKDLDVIRNVGGTVAIVSGSSFVRVANPTEPATVPRGPLRHVMGCQCTPCISSK
ncbi:hypothetical protein HGRIS_006954 [Hohenbuehelia grisea]|uniref:Uncharacterized protein n=1 Tax=Hohenbuehelia grisea TaxID=104357 RepID=A0ABR3JBR2_9AGAR